MEAPFTSAGEVVTVRISSMRAGLRNSSVMERGRTNFLRLLGADQRGLFEEVAKEAPGFAFVVRSMSLEFLKPARMDDILTVTTWPDEVKGASITLHQTVTRNDDVLVEAHVRVAFVSGGRARPIPKPLRMAMQAGLHR